MEFEMKVFRTLLQPLRGMNGRFDRYYAGVLRPGSGYPTADEARKDIARRTETQRIYEGWLR